MARPAARRLLDVIKKKRRKSHLAKLLPKAASTLKAGLSVGSGGGTLGRKKNDTLQHQQVIEIHVLDVKISILNKPRHSLVTISKLSKK